MGGCTAETVENPGFSPILFAEDEPRARVIISVHAEDLLLPSSQSISIGLKPKIKKHPQQFVNAQDEFMPVYAAHLRGIIQRGVDDKEHPEQPLRGFHIVVDAGNGGGGYFATDVLAPLGANTEGRLFRTYS